MESWGEGEITPAALSPSASEVQVKPGESPEVQSTCAPGCCQIRPIQACARQMHLRAASPRAPRGPIVRLPAIQPSPCHPG